MRHTTVSQYHLNSGVCPGDLVGLVLAVLPTASLQIKRLMRWLLLLARSLTSLSVGAGAEADVPAGWPALLLK